METLKFEVKIDAGRKQVWDTMLHPDTYREWVNVSWPGSHFEGKWVQGEDIKFLSAGQGGTLATLVEVRPYEVILARHVAVIRSDGSEDRTSDVARGWVGTTERYTFTETNGGTVLSVLVETSPEWSDMFSEGWPAALEKLKAMSEGAR